MPFFPLCPGFFSWYNKMYFSSCFSKFHLENLVFFSLHGLHCEKVKEACCIFSQIPATENGRHWTLSEFQIYCITGKQRSCAVRSLKETKIWWWKGGWCNSWIRSPVHFQWYILFHEIGAQFFHSFSVHSFIYSFIYQKLIECLFHGTYYALGRCIGLVMIWWNSSDLLIDELLCGCRKVPFSDLSPKEDTLTCKVSLQVTCTCPRELPRT